MPPSTTATNKLRCQLEALTKNWPHQLFYFIYWLSNANEANKWCLLSIRLVSWRTLRYYKAAWGLCMHLHPREDRWGGVDGWSFLVGGAWDRANQGEWRKLAIRQTAAKRQSHCGELSEHPIIFTAAKAEKIRKERLENVLRLLLKNCIRNMHNLHTKPK